MQVGHSWTCVTLFTYVVDQIETPIDTEILNGERNRFYKNCARVASTTYLIFSKIRLIQFYLNANQCKNIATMFFLIIHVKSMIRTFCNYMIYLPQESYSGHSIPIKYSILNQIFVLIHYSLHLINMLSYLELI